MREAVFYGAVTAMAMHEMQNVLAVIQQSAGLMADYLEMSRRESIKTLGFRKGFSHHDKFKELIGSIDEAVGRGTDLADSMGRLAHAPDNPAPRCDVAELAEFLFGLLGRMNRKKRTRFELSRPASGLFAGCSGLDALMALFAPTTAFAQGQRERVVRVVVGETDGTPMVDFIPSDQGSATDMAIEAGQGFFPPADPHGPPGPRLARETDRLRVVFPPCRREAEDRVG